MRLGEDFQDCKDPLKHQIQVYARLEELWKVLNKGTTSKLGNE